MFFGSEEVVFTAQNYFYYMTQIELLLDKIYQFTGHVSFHWTNESFLLDRKN